MNTNANPLLDFSGLPRFDTIRTGHVAPAVDQLLADARETVAAIATATAKPTWESLVEPLAEALDRLQRSWGAVRHLNAVVNSPELREAYNANLPKIVSFYAEIGQDLRLFARYRALRDSDAFASLDHAQRKLIENELRDFRLGGAELNDADKATLQGRCRKRLPTCRRNSMTCAGRDQCLGALHRRRDPTGRCSSRCAGRGARSRRSRRQVRLEAHAAHAVLPAGDAVRATTASYARRMHEALRNPRLGPRRQHGMGQRTDRRAHPGTAPRKWRTCSDIANYAELSLVPKMAQNPSEVLAFLRDLARRARPFAEQRLRRAAGVRPRRARSRRARAMGPRLRLRAA